jgi:hypothetical protein
MHGAWIICVVSIHIDVLLLKTNNKTEFYWNNKADSRVLYALLLVTVL